MLSLWARGFRPGQGRPLVGLPTVKRRLDCSTPYHTRLAGRMSGPVEILSLEALPEQRRCSELDASKCPHNDKGNFGFAFDNPLYSDCVVHIRVAPTYGPSTSAPAPELKLHLSRPILAARSVVFRKMFESGMVESATLTNREPIHVTLCHNELLPFQQLLHFIYTQGCMSTARTEADFFRLLQAADKYAVELCVERCVMYLWPEELLDEQAAAEQLDNCLQLLDMPEHLLTHAAVFKLQAGVVQMLSKYYKSIGNIPASRRGLMKFKLPVVRKLLESRTLAGDEESAFCLVGLWVHSAHSSLDTRESEEARDAFAELVGTICFPLMSACYFKEIVALSSLMRGHEYLMHEAVGSRSDPAQTSIMNGAKSLKLEAVAHPRPDSRTLSGNGLYSYRMDRITTGVPVYMLPTRILQGFIFNFELDNSDGDMSITLVVRPPPSVDVSRMSCLWYLQVTSRSFSKRFSLWQNVIQFPSTDFGQRFPVATSYDWSPRRNTRHI
eukprot:jgi/Chlat1/7359/Chrsp59S06963